MSTPIEREPRRVRPPYDTRDDRWDHLQATDPHAWRQAVHLDRLSALLEPLADVELSEREHAALSWLAGWPIETVAPLVRSLWAARGADPKRDGGGQ
jgi:hypothetical protein